MIPYFGAENLRVVMHDTDSLLYEITHTGSLNEHLAKPELLPRHLKLSKGPPPLLL